MNALLRGGAPLFATTWDGRVGVGECMPLPPVWPDFNGPGWEEYARWPRRVRFSLTTLRRYAQAVYAASEGYLATLSPADLDRAVDVSWSGQGQATVGWVVSRLLVGHIDNVCGEISCLKGLQGARGYPT